jgi:hypothetical protein
MRPVILPPWIIADLRVREWGLPNGNYVGSCWRSKLYNTITCTLPSGVETRALIEKPDDIDAWVPVPWQKAVARYCRQWPHSVGVECLIFRCKILAMRVDALPVSEVSSDTIGRGLRADLQLPDGSHVLDVPYRRSEDPREGSWCRPYITSMELKS